MAHYYAVYKLRVYSFSMFFCKTDGLQTLTLKIVLIILKYNWVIVVSIQGLQITILFTHNDSLVGNLAKLGNLACYFLFRLQCFFLLKLF